MVVWTDLMKMVAISSVVTLALSIILVLAVGTSERSALLLLVPKPKWPLFLLLIAIWCISLKVGYWWVFQRYTFYPPR